MYECGLLGRLAAAVQAVQATNATIWRETTGSLHGVRPESASATLGAIQDFRFVVLAQDLRRLAACASAPTSGYRSLDHSGCRAALGEPAPQRQRCPHRHAASRAPAGAGSRP